MIDNYFKQFIKIIIFNLFYKYAKHSATHFRKLFGKRKIGFFNNNNQLNDDKSQHHIIKISRKIKRMKENYI